MIELSWCQLPLSSALVCDYVHDKPCTQTLFKGQQHNRSISPWAVEAIMQTMQPLILSQKQKANLDALQHGSPVVIGGQQVGYLGGPLYTWLKIASIVHYAEGYGAVPVFWIEDNDHDTAEAQHVSIIGRDDTLRAMECPAEGAYQMQTIVAHYRIGSQIEQHRNLLQLEYLHTPFGRDVIAAFEECYASGRTWTEAFMRFHQRMWADCGVLFVRSSVLRTCGAMRRIIERELSTPGVLAKLVEQQVQELAACGYGPFVPSAYLNVFVHQGTQRYRVHRHADGTLRWGRRHCTHDELVKLLEQQPDSFSPSVLLRPLVQDELFAPAVSVLGPAELLYHAQLRRAYEYWGIPKADRVLRHSATLVPSRVMRVVQHHAHEITQLLQSTGAFERWVAETLDERGLTNEIADVQHRFASALEQLHSRAEEYDYTLGRAVGATQQRIAQVLAQLAQKVRHVVRVRMQSQLRRYYAVRTHLAPYGRLQERTIAPIHLLCSLGFEGMCTVLLSLCRYSMRKHYIATPNELLTA